MDMLFNSKSVREGQRCLRAKQMSRRQRHKACKLRSLHQRGMGGMGVDCAHRQSILSHSCWEVPGFHGWKVPLGMNSRALF